MAGVDSDLITEGRDAEVDRDLVAQPHQQEGPVAEAETIAAEMSSDEQPLGRPGRRFDRRSPFFVGMAAAAGVAVVGVNCSDGSVPASATTPFTVGELAATVTL